MSCCTDLTPDPITHDAETPLRTPPATMDRLVVEVDARAGLAHLERIVSLLRGRNHAVSGLSSDLRDGRAVVAVWGEDLHGGADDALVLRRLRRLPGVLHAQITDPREA